MTRTTILTAFVLFASLACGTPQGTPTDLANACAPDNEKKYLEVSGYIVPSVTVFCSNTGGRMECGFDFSDQPGGPKKMGVDVEQGSSANTMDKPPSGYKKEDLKIRDNAGNPINLNDKVKVTGKMSIEPSMNVCFMQVEKIER